MTDAELWQRIYKFFKEQSAVDRVAMKCLNIPEQRSFNPSNCTVREVSLSVASLHELKVHHQKTRSSHLDGPIVVLLYAGERFVIDGNTRVNSWLALKCEGPFSAIIIEPNA